MFATISCCRVTLYGIGEESYRLLGAKCFLARAEKEKFIAALSRARQNLKYENFASGRLRPKKKCTKKRAARAARRIIFRNSMNHVIGFWLCRCRRHFLKSLIRRKTTRLTYYHKFVLCKKKKKKNTLEHLISESERKNAAKMAIFWYFAKAIVRQSGEKFSILRANFKTAKTERNQPGSWPNWFISTRQPF